MVRVSALLVPPLVQPRLPEFPLGVLTVTLALPGPEIKVVESVTCNDWLFTTVVVSVAPLMITTEDATNSLPVTVSTNPCWTWANVIVLADSEPITGAGRALLHNGLRALHPGRNRKASTMADSAHGKKRKRWLGWDLPLRVVRSFANAA